MFFSLNKKILYSLFVFLLFVVFVFLVIFINLYSQKLQDSQNLVYMRNQYVVDLLYDNIKLKKELANLNKQYPEIVSSKIARTSQDINLTQKELTREQKLNAELQKNYDNNREAIITGAKIVGFSLFIVILFILLLIFLLDYWVIRPIEKLTDVSRKVSMGIFSSRIQLPAKSSFYDEFTILCNTFNNMLDNAEYNIEATRSRERFLQQLIDAIPDGIRVIDKNYNVIMANTSFYKLLKIKESCVGKKCYQAYGYNCDACPQSKYNCPIRDLQNNNLNYLHTIHEVDKIPLYVNAAKLRWKQDDEDYYIVEAIHDLSKDVRFSHQQKVSSLAFLSTSIAHEMKNNLGAIRLILEGLIDDKHNDVNKFPDLKKYLNLAHDQLVETVKIPERLLRLAQYSENEVSQIDVASAVKDMILMIDYDAKRHGIAIITDFDSKVLLWGNEADFKMIILNLTQNAIKAMPNGGELRITGKKDRKHILINISDTGVGIDSDKIKHIFEPFYSANDQIKSSGLGLAIVSSLIEKMKGHISVKSKLEKGTTFLIKLPIMQQSQKKKKS